MKVIIVFPNGFRYEYNILLTNKVKELKLGLENCRIVQDSQYFLTFNNRCLHDGSVLGDYGLINGSELIVNQRKPIKIIIESEDQGRMELVIMGDSLISEVKNKVINNNPLYDFSFEHEGRKLEDNLSLFELGITDNSVFQLIVKEK